MTDLYLNWPVGNHYGAGICGKYLLRELSKLRPVFYIEDGFTKQVRTLEEQEMVDKYKVKAKGKVKGTVIHSVDMDFKSGSPVWGEKNIAYIFYEWTELTAKQKENLKKYEVLIAGSEWNAEVTRDNGFDCISIPQGVDTEVFKPIKPINPRQFVIFSGGKTEPRKGQDIVIMAFKKFQAICNWAILMTSWQNIFSDRFDSYLQQVNTMRNVKMLPLLSHEELCMAMNDCSLGVFPNRCEGGTNLVLMELFASGRPAICDTSTGQADVCKAEYSWSIDHNNPVESLLDKLTYAFYNRENLHGMGQKAKDAMKEFSWTKTAEKFMEVI